MHSIGGMECLCLGFDYEQPTHAVKQNATQWFQRAKVIHSAIMHGAARLHVIFSRHAKNIDGFVLRAKSLSVLCVCVASTCGVHGA